MHFTDAIKKRLKAVATGTDGDADLSNGDATQSDGDAHRSDGAYQCDDCGAWMGGGRTEDASISTCPECGAELRVGRPSEPNSRSP